MTEDETIATEIMEERAGICEYSGLMTREQAEAQGKLSSDAYKAACEVRAVLAMPFTERRLYLDMVGEKRGLVARSALALAVNNEWIRRKAK